MTRIDFSPLYRNSVGFDRFVSLVDNALQTDKTSAGYPPYNIAVLEENKYSITLAVAGFKEHELDIQSENGVLTIRGKKDALEENSQYLHQGIATRSFERKFTLADYIEVVDAKLADGLLNVELVKNVPDALQPKKIAINSGAASLVEHKRVKNKDDIAA